MYTTSNNTPNTAISQNEKGSTLEEEVSDNDSTISADISSKRLCLTAISQRIILNVFHNLIKTNQQSTAVKKTSELTNIGIPSIYRLIKGGIQTKKTRLISVSPTIATVIENVISELQSSSKIFSIKTIRRLVKLKLPEINASTSALRLWMKKLGFKYALVPQKFSSKQELKDFLTAHNLHFEEDYSKKELLAVVAKHKYKSKRYILYKSKHCSEEY